MEFIKAVTFGYLSKRGEWETEEAKESLRLLKERMAITHVVLAVVVEQEHIHAIEINWQDSCVLSDEEVEAMVHYAHGLGLKVILKPMVNITTGHWRAHINFFDHDVPCEPKWSEWFSSYTAFIRHYGKMAEKTESEMFVIGCELVNADRREKEWRTLIKEVREVYNGPITYNCDKYQEGNITWWDAVDVISSSGYYPVDKIDDELARIEKVVQKEGKPFFFCEAGCASRVGAKWLPNNWELQGEPSLEEQKVWYEAFLYGVSKFSFVEGMALWDWKARLYPIEKATEDMDYALYGKPSETLVENFYKNN